MQYQGHNRCQVFVDAKISSLALGQPPLFKVVLWNDDYTPMEFVMTVLERFFFMDRLKAANLMFEAHRAGCAVVGLFSRDIAETKIDQVVDYATSNEHPLNCSMEAA